MRRFLGTWCKVACASVLVACGGASEPEEEVLRRSEAAGPAVSPPVFGGESATGGGSGEPDPPTPEQVDAFPDQSSTAFQIFVDPPRSVSVYCGDGVYDPAKEECDDGPGSTLDVCTPNCQTRDVLAVPLAQNSVQASRHLGYGRHQLSLNVTSDDQGRQGVGALVWTESPQVDIEPGLSGSAPRVVAQILDRHGNPSSRVVVADAASSALVGGNPLLAANPVSAVLPDGSIAVAYNDLNGDGSELGVGIRRLTAGPSTWSVGPVAFANQTFLGAQQDPDLIWTGSELVAAWVDTSNPSTAPDIRLRRYGEGLTTLGDEETLAGSAAPEGAVALTPWSRIVEPAVHNSYAAVWREALPSGAEALVVWHEGATVRVEPPAPLMPGAELDRPAIAPLDAHHVAVAFTVGTDPQATGVASVFRVQVAVVNVTTGVVVSQTMLAATNGDATRSQNQPALVAVVHPANDSLPTGQVFLGYRSDGALGNENGEDLWLKRLDWNGTALSFALAPVALPRTVATPLDHDLLDQRTPVLASLPVPGGAALGIAWEDFGQTFGPDQAQPDIVLQVAPIPMRRGAPVEKTCTAGSCTWGEGPCSSNAGCASGLTCQPGRGPWYGYGPETAVCAPATCLNGVQDGTETGVDCGSTCGTCFSCPGEEYWGTAHYCSAVCECDNLDGDCDTSFDCSGSLTCETDAGALAGLPEPIDLCMFGHCTDGIENADEVRADCGGADCPACDNGSDTYCVEEDCQEGEGDCLAEDAVCAPGLICEEGQGPIYGLPADVGVCVPDVCGNRGAPNTEGFCTTDCRCPDGVGLCDLDTQCLAGRCEPEVGLYFGLDAEAGVCMPDRCFNGVEDVGEEQIDCGGVCGTECPACAINPTFRSLENSNDFGIPTWDNLGTVTHPATISASSTATDGAYSLQLTHCNFAEVHSVPFSGTKFEIVGDELLVDVRFNVGGSGQAWEWLGDFAMEFYSASLGPRSLLPFQVFNRDDAGQWVTFRAPVTQDIRVALLEADEPLTLRFKVNRSCSVAGSSTGAVLIDNIRFGGDAVFRSECAPDEGGGGSGGGSGSGGSPGSGGSGGSGGGSGGSGGGSGGSGGGSGGSGGGSGGTGGSATEQIFSMDYPATWTSQQTQPVSSPDATQGSGSLQVPSGYNQVLSNTFPASAVGAAQRLLVDIKLPKKAPGQTLGGNLDAHVTCPSVGLNDAYVGTVTLHDKPQTVWFTGIFSVPTNVQTALNTNATDCRVKLTFNIWSYLVGSVMKLDDVRFDAPSPCTTYTQISTTPFSVGMPVVPDGTAARPWPLCTAGQVQTVMNTPALWDDHFRLRANISLSSTTGQIGTAAQPFVGTFDGDHNSFTNLSRTGTTDMGLFGVIQGDGNLDGTNDGYIRDLLLSSFTVSGTTRVGALAGRAQGRLQRVTVLTSNITGTSGDVGGLVGLLQARVVDAAVDSTVTGTAASRVGGLAGSCQGIVERSTAAGVVNQTGAGSQVGGLCGMSTETLQDDSTTNVVTANGSDVGGLVGLSTSDVLDCAAYGQVNQQSSSGQRTGGLLGQQTGRTVQRSSAVGAVVSSGSNDGGLVGLSTNMVLTDCYATGAVNGSNTTGGLLGSASGGSVTRAYGRGVITSSTPRGRFVGSRTSVTVASSYTSSSVNAGMASTGTGPTTGITAVTATQLAQQATYSGWNFSTIWFMGVSGAELR